MLPYERRQDILRILNMKKAISVNQLSSEIFASPATIRRDLNILAKEGILRRTRGGAVLLGDASFEIPFMLREKDNEAKKSRIAEMALDFVIDDSTLFMDSSSTSIKLARRLNKYKGLKILTNGMMTSHILSEHTDAIVYCTGGRVRNNESSITGSEACEYIARHHADVAFVSCRGINSTYGAMESTEEEAMIKKYFHMHANTTILLVDSSKFDKTYFHTGLSMAEIDIIITDRPVSEAMQSAAEEHNIRIIY